ncbi:MAG TPA: amidohydrolase family protein [Nitrososphaerales archaeon]|nr:amidohydrolase family protein [Nitrososphaerales archaeon]
MPQQQTIIDAYTHSTPTAYLKYIAIQPNPEMSKQAQRLLERCKTHPNMIDFDVRLSQMDKYRIAKQITCIFPEIDPNRLPTTDSNEQLKLCKMINDGMAETMKKGRGRVLALGTAPLKAMNDGGLEEMRRAVEELGLRGFMAVTNVGGEPVDQFTQFWDEANRLGVAVYLHPVDPINSKSRPYEDEFDLMHVLGWPFETSLAMGRLVLSGTMSRNPNLRVVAHHLGAMIPYFSGRINESYDKDMSFIKSGQKFYKMKDEKPPIEHFDSFLLDSAIGGSVAAIKCAREVFGAEKIIFGTDYPFGPGDGSIRMARYPSVVEQAGFSASEKQLIFEENASKLLKI